ncbi:zinc knuckle CX2CX4HX4C containing protein [Tanacetum coccineum]
MISSAATKELNTIMSNFDKRMQDQLNNYEYVQSAISTMDFDTSTTNTTIGNGNASIVELFGVSLKTLVDIDDFTKDIELGKYEVWSTLPSDKRKEVMDTICAMWDTLMAENVESGSLDNKAKDNTNLDDTMPVDESTIVQCVSIQEKPSSYVVTAGGSLPKPCAVGGSTLKPSKSKANFRLLFSKNLCEGVNVSILRKTVQTVSTRFANTLYGYFIGLEDVLDSGPWMIRNNPIILKKWSMNNRLCKEELSHILVWVKIHDVPIQVFSKDGLSIIASQIGKPIMLDSYTSSMCIESWERSSFARCLIEINSEDALKESLTIGVPLIEDMGFTIETVSNPLIVNTPIAEKTNDGFQTVGEKKKKGNITMSNSYVALYDESKEDIENVYDESANLLNSTKKGESSSTFSVAAG